MGPLLDNYNIVITGGTGFLGREIVAEFLKEGAHILTNYRNQNKFDDLKIYSHANNNLIGIQADLTSEEQVLNLFQEIKSRFKRLDIFLHIAGGFWMGGEIGDTPVQKWNDMMNLNLFSTFLCTREAFKIMKKQCGGKIFTVSSKTAEEFPAQMGAYSVSKAGVLGLSQVLANEGKPYNIQVNSILPSIIDTSANRKAMPDSDYSKWVTPKEIARLLVQLGSPELKNLSHTAIKVYGQV
jgi:NAD(P)-dependent dehydrogenase (short-subunit alcohol dehydrogenase family)